MGASELELEWRSRLPGLQQLWAQTRGRSEIRVAVLDGPVAYQVLSNSLVAPSGAIEHGTLVSSILTGSADGGVPGLAPGCTTAAIPIFEEPGDGGQIVCSQDVLADAIDKALAFGAHIINISASQLADALALSSSLSAALQSAADRDVLIAAAVGNHGCSCDTIPASVPGVLAVGAHDEEGAPLPSSNWGPGQRAEGLLAPGISIPGTCTGGGLCRGTGTSFATAIVSAVAALLMSLDLDQGRPPSGRRIKQALLQSCDPCRPEFHELCSVFLGGRLNVSRAVDSVLQPDDGIPEGEDRVTIGQLGSTDTLEAHLSPQSLQVDASPATRVDLPVAENSLPVAVRTGLQPADCGCGGKCNGDCKCGGGGADKHEHRTQLAYAIGRLGVSFISQARRDSIWRTMNGQREGDLKPIRDEELRALFEEQPYQAQSVIWTLSRTEVPMYAIVPTGAFAAETYQWLVEEWSDTEVEFVSIPGVIAGQVRLYDGNTVDVLVPDLRGMNSWENTRFRDALISARQDVSEASEVQVRQEIDRFLGKVMFRIRNRGLQPEERALNAAITNAFNFSDVIAGAVREGLVLKDVSVERSPLSRSGSDYYDVLVTFFNPRDRLGTANLLARFTIDVSDTVPVMIGDPVTWFEY